jgi:hypothetical protein
MSATMPCSSKHSTINISTKTSAINPYYTLQISTYQLHSQSLSFNHQAWPHLWRLTGTWNSFSVLAPSIYIMHQTTRQHAGSCAGPCSARCFGRARSIRRSNVSPGVWKAMQQQP